MWGLSTHPKKLEICTVSDDKTVRWLGKVLLNRKTIFSFRKIYDFKRRRSEYYFIC